MTTKRSSSQPLVSILLAVRNEAEHLPVAVGVINAVLNYSHEILVIYDLPEDNTVPVAKKLQKKFPNLRLIYNRKGRGLVNAYGTGIDKARGKYIALIPTDDSAPTPSVNAAIDLLIKGCDFVSGTRYANGGKRIGRISINPVLSKTANKLIFLATKTFSDSTTGFKIFRKSVYRLLTPKSQNGGGMFLEMSINANQLGLKMGEVPFVSIDRLYGGKSTLEFKKWIGSYLPLFFQAVKKAGGAPKIKRLKLSEVVNY